MWRAHLCMCLCARVLAVPLHLIEDGPRALDEARQLVGRGGGAGGPADAAQVVDEVDVADLAVEQADGLADLGGDGAAHEKVATPLGGGEAAAQAAHEEADEPGLERVVLHVEAHELQAVVAAGVGEQGVEGGVGGGGEEGVGLVLGPAALEQGDDGRLAVQDVGRGAEAAVRGVEGVADKVGEEEGDFGFEGARRREEGLAVVELEVAPVAEVGAGHLGFSVSRQ
ncbi:hypothetical protein BN1708_004304 [Verticillium longisporum]|uniref:Uncharacterized protein n=1 Tax=Verticillium longisporum TaxID=100787 RepID=A0A0G4LYK4_VERLO|nr:hypothetical protein BN1708_004304 [Verticillium longisporum]